MVQSPPAGPVRQCRSAGGWRGHRSTRKLVVLLRREGFTVSESTVGRVIATLVARIPPSNRRVWRLDCCVAAGYRTLSPAELERRTAFVVDNGGR